MHKAVIGLIMAATVLTPIAAQAQDRVRGDRGGGRTSRAERVQQLEQRSTARVERQQNSEPRVQRQETPPPQVQTPTVQVDRRGGGDGGGDRGTRGGGGVD